MTSPEPVRNRLVELRREFHRTPEPAWREYYTTHRLVQELEGIGVEHLYVGRDALAVDERMALPDPDEDERSLQRARERGADENLLESMAGGLTGAVAVVGDGDPVIGLRVDIDALFVKEATGSEHTPAAEGFRSEHEGLMHACGHDAHMTIGLGVLEAVAEGDFGGTFKLFLQPAEERAAGGKPMAESGHLADVDYLLALHVGLNHPTGEIVAGMIRPLANRLFTATFFGESAHAGAAPEEGRNAMQALGAAIQNVYGIARHSAGATRVNLGRVEGGTASNVVADHVRIEGEARAETTAVQKEMFDRVRTVLEHAAEMHDCEVDIEVTGDAPRADSDEALATLIQDVAQQTEDITSPITLSDFGASEDATYLMDVVESQGGKAAYSIIGTDHPTGHHTSHFDIDEKSLSIGVELMSESISKIASERP